MTLVVIEGFDGCGKSTIIDQLKRKYPSIFTSFAYPTPSYRKKVDRAFKRRMEHYSKDLKAIIKYHTLFLEDFAENNRFLTRKRKKVMLLDRYIYSHAAYANTDICKHFVMYRRKEDYHFTKDIMKEFYRFYSELKGPDIVIYLEKPNVISREEKRHCYFYNINFKEYSPRYLYHVKALRPDTLESVEDILRMSGVL